MERVAPPEREAKLWRVIERYLWTDLGLLTTQPAYVRTQPTGSYIQKLAPGTYENASVYCHGTAFYMAACAAAGRGDQALAAAVAALPTNPKNHRCDLEPYGTTNFYVGPDSKHFGRAPHSWFTGSAAWFLFVGWEGLLGIQPEFDGLRLAPCVPRSWTNWRVTREFRGACYDMTFRKPRGSKGLTVKRLAVDGKDFSGNIVPVLSGGAHRVEVELA
jgi:cellobiose phosphorylase